MAQVTIEGSTVTPSDALGRGKRTTVEVTDHIRQLVKIGAVVVVAGSLDGGDPSQADDQPEHTGSTDDPQTDSVDESEPAPTAAAAAPPASGTTAPKPR